MNLRLRRPSSNARREHLRGLLRVGAYMSALTLVVGAFQVRAARAEFQDRSLEIGKQLRQLTQATHEDLNKISMNGQPMWVGSAVTESPVKGVLDRYETYCNENRSHSSEEWQKLGKEVGGTGVSNKSLFSTGVMRGGSDQEGTVVCFTKSESTKPTFGDSLKAFTETGELGALGAFRYVYAKTTEKGNTLVLTAWTDDKFNLHKLVPEEGQDVAGNDFTDIPRSAQSNRIFSTRIEGTPFGVNVYRSKEPPSKVTAFYDEAMTQRGWAALAPKLDETSDDGSPVLGRLYERDGVVLTLSSHTEQGESFTALGLAGVSAELDRTTSENP